MVYDTTDIMSFKNLQYWLKKIKKHSDENVEIILLGNKNDLINDQAVNKNQAWNEVAFPNDIQIFETSAKNASSVDQVFKFLINRIIHKPQLRDKIKIVDSKHGQINVRGNIKLESFSKKKQFTVKEDKLSRCCS